MSSSLVHLASAAFRIDEREKALSDDVFDQMFQVIERMVTIRESLKQEGKHLDLECNQLQAALISPSPDYPSQWAALSASSLAKMDAIRAQMKLQENNFQSMAINDHDKKSCELAIAAKYLEMGALKANLCYSNQSRAAFACLVWRVGEAKKELQLKEPKWKFPNPLQRAGQGQVVEIQYESQLVEHKAGTVFRAKIESLANEITNLTMENSTKKTVFCKLQQKEELERENSILIKTYETLVQKKDP